MSKPVNLHTAVAGVYLITTDEQGNALVAAGTTVPSAVAGFAKGCLFIKIGTSSMATWLYLNSGTASSCTFTAANISA